jgi:hypothetical protein
MTYYKKVKIINYVLPLLIVIIFAKLGVQSTRSLFAQTPPSSAISMSTPQSAYLVGQDITVMLSNLSDSDAYVVNNCPGNPLSVQRRENNSWVAVQENAPISKCVNEPVDYKIPSDSSIRIDYKFWPELFVHPDTYRIHADIEPSATGPTIEFVVKA